MNQNINNQINNNINNANKEETPDDSGDGKAKKKISGKFLVGLIVMVILYQYYSYVFWLKPLLAPGEDYFVSRIIILIIFHLLLFMMIWSFIVTMRTIPGFIPLYWGFYIGDEEYKRKRYCLICNAFKPERSHHCSVCNICVLNMDHHCPWVNNCIGFYNRKFFMQLLFYLLVLLLFMDLSCVVEIYEILKHIYTTKFKVDSGKMINYLVVLPAYMICLVLTVLNTMFFKYHLQLVFNNSTTIESLDPENKENTKVIL
jgi:palmitoyltransferase